MSGFKEAHPLYSTWKNMKQRCYNQNNRYYANYGGRGIKVCPAWLLDFWAFVEDMGPRPEGMTLDRRDNNGDYTPVNCVWASRKTQSQNKRVRAGSKTGVKGVRVRGRKFRASIGVDGKNIELGTFATAEEAAEVRKAAEIKYWGCPT